jgi:hypothetical protein
MNYVLDLLREARDTCEDEEIQEQIADLISYIESKETAE